MDASVSTWNLTEVDASIFRAYDIRGVAYDAISEEVAYIIGLSFASLALSHGVAKLSVGRDGRLSGPDLSAALIQGMLDAGCHVVDIGLVPTPLLYFSTVHVGTGSGVMVTGSHNPTSYNGFKFMLQGKALFGSQIQGLYNRIQAQQFAQGQGTLTTLDVAKAYVREITEDIQFNHKMKIVIDAGNGAAGDIAKTLFRQMNLEVVDLYCDIDGRFPNHHPDPSKPENLQDLIELVKSTHADVGFAFDGDGDRLGVVNKSGEILWPDRVLEMFAKDILAREPGANIVFDVKCSRALIDAISEHNGVPVMCKTGHSFIKAKMQDCQAQLAGEMSGHFFFKDRWYGFDDGMYAACRLLEIIDKSAIGADMLLNLPERLNTPEITISFDDEKKFEFIQSMIEQAEFEGAQIVTIDGMRVEYPNRWGLLRASNTTPSLVARFEGNDAEALAQIQSEFATQIKRLMPELMLPF